MPIKVITFSFGLICLGSLLVITNAKFEENDKFCIRTEPMLLTDMEKHVNPIEIDPNCEILATTLTIKERESFLSTMCKDHGGTHKDDYQYFKLRNGELAGRSSHHAICSINLPKVYPLLAWVPYKTIQQNFAHELNPKERLNYIGKATDVEREKTELCHFRHSDLVTNISANLFTCVVMIFEDNFYGLDSNINVLVEIEPIMYELRNITYQPWINVTASYKTQLGKTVVKNTSREKKQIYGSISFAYVEKVQLNVSSVYGDNLEKLPLLFEHKGAVLELNENGVGGVDVKEKAYFGRVVDEKMSVKVDVIGQWAEHRQKFTADIYEYFGYGIKRFRNEMHNGDVSFVRIDSTEPVYEMPELTHLGGSTIYKGLEKSDQKLARLATAEVNVNNCTEADVNCYNEEWPTGGHPYPGLYPWSVAAAIIIGVVLLAAVIGVVRSCSKNEEKQKYKFTGIRA